MTFEELITYLKNDSELGLNTATSEVQIALANVKLKQANLPPIPEDFGKLLKNFNGISNNGSIILGVNTGTAMFPELVKFNVQTIGNQESSSIILGYDDMYYLIYDYERKAYRIIDKDDFSEEAETIDFAQIITYLLKV